VRQIKKVVCFGVSSGAQKITLSGFNGCPSDMPVNRSLLWSPTSQKPEVISHLLLSGLENERVIKFAGFYGLRRSLELPDITIISTIAPTHRLANAIQAISLTRYYR
jgi:hypothetical protein